MAADYYEFKFPRRSVDGKHLIRFQSEKSVFKFFRCSLWIIPQRNDVRNIPLKMPFFAKT